MTHFFWLERDWRLLNGKRVIPAGVPTTDFYYLSRIPFWMAQFRAAYVQYATIIAQTPTLRFALGASNARPVGENPTYSVPAL